MPAIASGTSKRVRRRSVLDELAAQLLEHVVHAGNDRLLEPTLQRGGLRESAFRSANSNKHKRSGSAAATNSPIGVLTIATEILVPVPAALRRIIRANAMHPASSATPAVVFRRALERAPLVLGGRQ